jgi:hypothetical protein
VINLPPFIINLVFVKIAHYLKRVNKMRRPGFILLSKNGLRYTAPLYNVFRNRWMISHQAAKFIGISTMAYHSKTLETLRLKGFYAGFMQKYTP